MAVTIGTWTTDHNGQQWYYSVNGWTKGSGFSGGNPVEWSDISDADRPGQVVDTAVTEETSVTATQTILSGPVDGKTGAESGTLRWPKDVKYSESDYVLFQFGKYIPPFSRDITELRQSDGLATNSEAAAQETRSREYINAAGYDLYNQENLDIDDPEVSDLKTIVLPIPQDLSNELQAVCQCKQFTT